MIWKIKYYLSMIRTYQSLGLFLYIIKGPRDFFPEHIHMKGINLANINRGEVDEEKGENITIVEIN